MTDLDAPVAAQVVGRQARLVDGGVDGEAVVVGGDLHPSGGPVEHGLVDAAVAVVELVGAVAQGPSEQLVAQADAEEGDAGVEHPAQQLDLAHGRARVAGAVGEEHAVGVQGQDLGEGRRLRQDVDAHAPFGQLPGGAGLDAQVDGGHDGDGLGAGEVPGGFDDVALGRGHLGGQGLARHARLAAHGVQADVDGGPGGAGGAVGPGGQGLAGEDAGAHGAALAQVAGQGPGVDLAHAHDPGARQLVLQFAPGPPGRGAPGRVAHHVAGDPDPARLGVLVVDARIADVGGGLHHDLAVVGGVGERLLVAGHAGVEDDLAHGAPGGAVGPSAQHVAVLQDEQGRAARGQAGGGVGAHLSPPRARRARRPGPWGARAGRSP